MRQLRHPLRLPTVEHEGMWLLNTTRDKPESFDQILALFGCEPSLLKDNFIGELACEIIGVRNKPELKKRIVNALVAGHYAWEPFVIRAMECNDIEFFSQLLFYKPNVRIPVRNKGENRPSECVRWDDRGIDGENILTACARLGGIDYVKKLIELNMLPNAQAITRERDRGGYGSTVLSVALAFGQRDFIEYLFSQFPTEIFHVDVCAFVAAVECSRKGRGLGIECVTHLINRGYFSETILLITKYTHTEMTSFLESAVKAKALPLIKLSFSHLFNILAKKPKQVQEEFYSAFADILCRVHDFISENKSDDPNDSALHNFLNQITLEIYMRLWVGGEAFWKMHGVPENVIPLELIYERSKIFHLENNQLPDFLHVVLADTSCPDTIKKNASIALAEQFFLGLVEYNGDGVFDDNLSIKIINKDDPVETKNILFKRIIQGYEYAVLSSEWKIRFDEILSGNFTLEKRGNPWLPEALTLFEKYYQDSIHPDIEKELDLRKSAALKQATQSAGYSGIFQLSSANVNCMGIIPAQNSESPSNTFTY